MSVFGPRPTNLEASDRALLLFVGLLSQRRDCTTCANPFVSPAYASSYWARMPPIGSTIGSTMLTALRGGTGGGHEGVFP